MKQKTTASIFILLTSLFITSVCKKSVITRPGARETKSERWADLISKGDREFEKMYWAGWNMAISHYEKAWKISRDENLKQRLFFSYLLLAMREKEFHVRNEEVLNKAEKLLTESNSNELDIIYLDIARRTVMTPGLWEKFQSQQLPEISRETIKRNIAFLKANSHTDYRFYFYLDYLGRYGGNEELKKNIRERDRFLKEFPESNLRVSLGDSQYQLEQMLDKYPDFIELIMIQADQFYRTGKYSRARSGYRSVLEINPRMPFAHTGLGSIFFWLELYDEAENCYNQAMAITPNFSRALFGKAMCKHYLDRFEQSNAILTQLLESQPLYHGEAYFYRALNHFNLKKNNQVKKNIQTAMTFIPDSIDLNAFAGIFYYYLKDLKKAKSHLQKVFEHRIHHPDAAFYTGLIALKEKKPADTYFITAARYYWDDLKKQKIKMDGVDNLDLKENLKNKLRVKRFQRLKENGRDSLEKLKKIMTVYTEVKETYYQISEFSQKIKNLVENLSSKNLNCHDH